MDRCTDQFLGHLKIYFFVRSEVGALLSSYLSGALYKFSNKWMTELHDNLTHYFLFKWLFICFHKAYIEWYGVILRWKMELNGNGIFSGCLVCVLAKDVPSAGDYTLNVRVVLSVCVREWVHRSRCCVDLFNGASVLSRRGPGRRPSDAQEALADESNND